MKALWAIAAVAVALAAALAACGDSEEEIAPAPTTAGATATARPIATPAPTPEPTPVATTPAVPADWPTYSNPDGLFTIRYPPSWFERDNAFYSSNPDNWTRPSQPPEVLAIHAGYYEAAGSGACGAALSVDPKSGEGTPVPGATPASLGGVMAWEKVRESGDPLLNDPYTRIQAISLIYKGYCFSVTGYFTQQTPDVDVFLRIASTFEFTF